MSNRSCHFSRRVLISAACVAFVASACTTTPPDVTPSALPTAVLATVTPAATFAPVQAPEGLSVAFVADGTLWLWRVAEDPVPLTRADAFPAPTLSSDGAWIAFYQAGAVAVIGADGAGEQLVPGANQASQAAWRPDHGELFVMTPAETATVLQRFDPATGEASEVARFAVDAAFTFAPDGAHLAVVTPERLQLLDAQGAAVGTALDFPAVAIGDTQRWRPTPVWVDATTARLFTITTAGLDAETVVWQAALDAEPSEVARQPGAAFGGLLAPDGRALLFTRSDQTLGLWDLETGEARQVVDAQGAAALAWTPNSRAFVYTGIDPLQPFVLGLEPDAFARPAGVGPVMSLSWLTGDWLLYTSVTGGGEQLRLAEVGNSDGLIGISAAGAIGFDSQTQTP